MKKRLGLKTKIEAGIVIMILLTMGIGSVLSVTRTITDSSDTIETYIRNSNGNYWDATGANIQLAINDASGGWVEIPGDTNITITTHLTIPDNVWLRGGGNSSILYLEDGADDNIIENSDQTNGNTGIKITDLVLDGNGWEQTLWDGNIATHAGDKYNGIYFKNVYNSSVTRCYIHDTACAGIVTWEDENNYYCNNWITKAGLQWEGHHPADWHPCGILSFSADNCHYDSNTIWSIYSNGISTEKRVSLGSTNNTINNNIIYDCFYGIYIENVNNHTISDNIISDCNKEDAYIPTTHAGGIRLGAGIYPVDDTIVSNNIITSCGNLSSANGFGIYSEGDGNIFTGNTVIDSQGYGIYIGSGDYNILTSNTVSYSGDEAITMAALNSIVSNNIVEFSTGNGILQYYAAGDDPADNLGSTISGNIITGSSSRGISAYQDNTAITGNVINGTGDDGIKLNSMHFGTVTGNSITDSSHANDGIEVSSAVDMIISLNIISGYLDGIDEVGSSDYNIYVGNNARHCSNGFDFNGANNEEANNMGTLI